jgi:hypothetical protein
MPRQLSGNIDRIRDDSQIFKIPERASDLYCCRPRIQQHYLAFTYHARGSRRDLQLFLPVELLLLPESWIFQRTVSNRRSPSMRPMQLVPGSGEFQGPSGLLLGKFGTSGPEPRPKLVRRGSTSREFLFVVLRSTFKGTSDGVKRPFLSLLLILPGTTERKYIEK